MVIRPALAIRQNQAMRAMTANLALRSSLNRVAEA